MTELRERTCVPCRGGVPALEPDRIAALLPQLAPEWRVDGGHHLSREIEFPDFVAALAFVVRLGAIAEAEGHHPDVHLRWGQVRLEIWTHAIDGLTESDFILAAKADAALTAATS